MSDVVLRYFYVLDKLKNISITTHLLLSNCVISNLEWDSIFRACYMHG